MILKTVQRGQYWEWAFCAWMQVRTQNVKPLTEVQIGEFLRGSQALELEI